jgi:uncharacterized protein (DUF302 family)
MFNYTVASTKSYDQAIADLKQALSVIKFSVCAELDPPSKLKENGVDFQGKIRILELCNPNYVKAELEKNIKACYFLPFKVVVYEEEGITYIGMPKLTVLIDLLEDGNLRDVAEAVEGDLKTAIDAAR